MLLFATKIKAIDPLDGELKEWIGPVIQEISFANAEKYLQQSGLGYCIVVGIVDMEIKSDVSIIKSYINPINN